MKSRVESRKQKDEGFYQRVTILSSLTAIYELLYKYLSISINPRIISHKVCNLQHFYDEFPRMLTFSAVSI